MAETKVKCQDYGSTDINGEVCNKSFKNANAAKMHWHRKHGPNAKNWQKNLVTAAAASKKSEKETPSNIVEKVHKTGVSRLILEIIKDIAKVNNGIVTKHDVAKRVLESKQSNASENSLSTYIGQVIKNNPSITRVERGIYRYNPSSATEIENFSKPKTRKNKNTVQEMQAASVSDNSNVVSASERKAQKLEIVNMKLWEAIQIITMED